MVKIKFISLVNLVADREVVKELIQDELTTENLTQELNKIITTSGRNKMLADYKEIENQLGGKGAATRAARLMVNYLTQITH